MSDYYQDKDRLREEARLKYIAKSEEISNLIGALPEIRYGVDISFNDIEWQIESYRDRYDGFDENPDFQRGHVWTEQQQIKYVEALIKGNENVPRNIILNCPDFQRDDIAKDSDLKGFVVVDGLQRLTAVRRFLNDEFKIFTDKIEGGVDKNYFDQSRFNLKSNIGLRFQVMNYQYKHEVLKFYIEFNTGGTIHSESEIERVKALLEKEMCK